MKQYSSLLDGVTKVTLTNVGVRISSCSLSYTPYIGAPIASI